MTGVSLALTGVGTFWGLELATRLVRCPGIGRVLALDRYRPPNLDAGVEFAPLDLLDAEAPTQLARALEGHGVEGLVHLAFPPLSGHQTETDGAPEVVGTGHVLQACAAVSLPRLVVASSTMLYGASPSNPQFISETQSLASHPHFRALANRVEVERLTRTWGEDHCATAVTVLRHCWPMGPNCPSNVVRFFEQSVVPTWWGYDPLLQFIHEQDLLAVYEEAALRAHPGIFNIVGKGVRNLSRLIALAGKSSLPLPGLFFQGFARPFVARPMAEMAPGFYEYLRYLWVADGERGWAEFGEPLYSTQEAWLDFVVSRRTARSAR